MCFILVNRAKGDIGRQRKSNKDERTIDTPITQG